MALRPQTEAQVQPQAEHSPEAPQARPTWNNRRMRVFKRKDARAPPSVDPSSQQEKGHAREPSSEPRYNADGHLININGHKVTLGIQPDGESGRSWFGPLHFLRICWASSCTASRYTNVLWPFTIAALALYFHSENHLWIFICSYIGMVPAANLVGFAGQELARKLPKVAGVILETTFGSIVEIVLFVVLIKRNEIHVIQAAILGSILANMLFCLGLCFFVGGIFHPQQTFHEAISEVGSNLMLVAAVGLIIPTIYYNSLTGSPLCIPTNDGTAPDCTELTLRATKISYATAIVLLVAFCVYVWFQTSSHHGLYEDILEADEERDHDRHRDLAKPKLTLFESILAVVVALMFVTFMAVFLVENIDFIKERGVSDAFLGLILVPIVEKAAEHITAVDEAYDNQMNFALSHVLGASIQTALLNTPLIVLIGWGINPEMDLIFEVFDAIMLILAIIVVGSFLRDEKSDYLEGALCVFVYILIGVTAWYYPNPIEATEPTSGESEGGELAAEVAKRLVRMAVG